MKKHTIISIVLSIFAASVFSASAADYGIIPQPRSLTPKEGVFTFDRTTVVTVETDDALFGEVAVDFAARLRSATGLNIKVADNTSAKAKSIVFRKVEGLQTEEYKLDIDKKIITISASEANGAFYAVQTIYQLLPAEIYGKTVARGVKWSVPCCAIADSPLYSYRSLMMDCGRYFMPKEEIFRVIDMLAMHKQNIFHWHLTEDQGWRIEIKKYPRLTEVGAWRSGTSGYKKQSDNVPHGGFYTQDDAREVVEYARKRFVTVVPEIELPGHATAAIAAYPELSCFPDRKYEVATAWGVMKDVFCPNAATFTFLEDVFTELFDIFPSKYYHIGGDECPRDSWQESRYVQDFMKVMGFDNEDQVQIFFVQRMQRFLSEKGGKTVIGWDEILDGGAVPETIALSYRGHAPAAKAVSRDMYTILTPNRWCYLDYYQEDPDTEPETQSLFLPLEKVYNYQPTLLDTLAPDKVKYILGIQGSVWAEFIPTPERFEYSAFPRAVALSEVCWNPKSERDWDSFRERMVKEMRRLDTKGINCSRAFYNVIFNFDRATDEFPKEVKLTLDYPDAVIRYTTDGSAPTAKSAVCPQSINVNKGDVIRAQGFTSKGKPIGKAVNKTFK